MKIIREGDAERARVKRLQTVQFTCEECGCIFLANKDEYSYHPHPDQYQESWYTVECPYCGTTIRPNYSKVRKLYE